MEKHIVSFFNNYGLPLQDKKLVVAVSTGIDSMVLLHALLQVKETISFEVVIAHVHHGVREESDREEAFIKEYAHTNHLPIFVKHINGKEFHNNFQMKAREARYLFFEEVMKQIGADYLLLAHHARDQMETIIMRIMRGSSIGGYAGMSDVIHYQNYLVVRPLLTISKTEISSYALEHGIPYFEDATNDTDVYLRNRIRSLIIPELEHIAVDVHEKFQEFSNSMRFAQDQLDKLVDIFINRYVQIENEIVFDAASLLMLEPIMQQEVVFRLLGKYQLSKKMVQEVIEHCKSDKPNIVVTMANRFTFIKEYNKIIFHDGAIKKKDIFVLLEDVGSYPIYDNIQITVSKKSSNQVPKPNELWYNSRRLPIKVRSRKPGDKILLSAGYKKVKDLLIDRKVPKITRDQLILLEDNQGEIVAILGIQKSKMLENLSECDIVIQIEENE